jgi:hypothetical protein
LNTKDTKEDRIGGPDGRVNEHEMHEKEAGDRSDGPTGGPFPFVYFVNFVFKNPAGGFVRSLS